MDGGRAQGALLGLAVGDALGTTLEFTRPSLPRPWALMDGPHRDISGGGPFRVARGQVTDDTQMAVCLATSLVERGRFDREDVMRAYVGWEPHAFDVGSLTSAALARARKDADAGRRAWEKSGRQSAGNGSLMRTAPIGVFFCDDVAARRDASLSDSSITHFDPRCQLACALYNAAIARAIRTGDAHLARDAAELELRAAADLLRERHPDLVSHVDSAEEELGGDLALARMDDPELQDLIHSAQGFVRVSLRLAFWVLEHAPSFEAGLVDVVNRGGDADTNGAIAGALLGALHGESAIPARWSEPVVQALADAPDHPLCAIYHPTRLLAALDRWIARARTEGRDEGDVAEDLFELVPEKRLRLVWDELIGAGPLAWDDAIRRAARGLRDKGLLRFERLHESSPAYEEIRSVIKKELRTDGVMFDRGNEARGQVRAIVGGPEEVSKEAWREFLLAVVGDEPVEREEAVRLAAHFAREAVGLSFQRLRMDGIIASAIRSAMNSAVRRGEIERVGSRKIRRAQRQEAGKEKAPGESGAEVGNDDGSSDEGRHPIEHTDDVRTIQVSEVLAVMVPESFGSCESAWAVENLLAEVAADFVRSTVKEGAVVPILIAHDQPQFEGLHVWLGLPRSVPAKAIDMLREFLVQFGARVSMEYASVERHGFTPLLVVTSSAIEVPLDGTNLMDETLESLAGSRPVLRRPILLM